MEKLLIPSWISFPKKSFPSQVSRLKGFTLLEALIVTAILGTFITLMVPAFNSLMLKGRNNQAVSDIVSISQKIEDFFLEHGYYPETLSEVGVTDLTDPWGNPYEYLPIFGKKTSEVSGKWRKDRFLIPLNSDFDLYSMGADEATMKPLTPPVSWDDIVRANNGEYIGLGSKY
jgi:general secretion pathway protein G